MSSFRSAGAGLARAVRSERNLRIHLVAAVIVSALCWWLRIPRSEICLIVVAVTLVWMTELLNTAIERLVDLLSPEYSELARDVKDIAAAAVLSATAGAVLIGLFVFGPPLVNAFSGGGGI